MAEEKEVKGIVSKLMEARHSKSMDSYELLARFCSKESITKLILPLKEASRQTNNACRHELGSLGSQSLDY